MSGQVNQLPTPSHNGCVAFSDQFNTRYGYLPSLGAGIAFLAIFGFSMSAHLFQAVRRRQTTSLVFATVALIELLGWAGRTWSAICPYNRQAFLIQFTTHIIAPSFLLIGAYLVLRLLMLRIGSETGSYISANVCFYVLFVLEVISLGVQVLGAGLAARALDTKKSTKSGTNIMVAGSIFQLVSISIFFLFSVDFLRRVRRDFALTRSELMVGGAMSLSVFALLIRSIYRAVECAQGWSGYLATHQYFFLGLDAAMTVIAVGIHHFVDPAVMLRPTFSHTPVRIYVDDGESISELSYQGATFEMVKGDELPIELSNERPNELP